MWGLTCTKLALLWMTALVPPESVSYSSSFTETAVAMCAACESGTQCTAVLTALGYHESRFNPTPCNAHDDCDHGQSVGIWQISRYWEPGETVWAQAFTAARLVRASLSICKARPLDERLGNYASGGGLCNSERGAKLSRTRMALARALLH